MFLVIEGFRTLRSAIFYATFRHLIDGLDERRGSEKSCKRLANQTVCAVSETYGL